MHSTANMKFASIKTVYAKSLTMKWWRPDLYRRQTSYSFVREWNSTSKMLLSFFVLHNLHWSARVCPLSGTIYRKLWFYLDAQFQKWQTKNFRMWICLNRFWRVSFFSCGKFTAEKNDFDLLQQEKSTTKKSDWKFRKRCQPKDRKPHAHACTRKHFNRLNWIEPKQWANQPFNVFWIDRFPFFPVKSVNRFHRKRERERASEKIQENKRTEKSFIFPFRYRFFFTVIRIVCMNWTVKINQFDGEMRRWESNFSQIFKRYWERKTDSWTWRRRIVNCRCSLSMLIQPRHLLSWFE